MTSRLRFSTARQVFEAFSTLAEDVSTPPAEAAPLDFTRSLLASPTPEDAVSFCAYVLPRREAVWWACQCVRATLDERDGVPPALASAEAWVREPEEERRRTALQAGLAGNPRLAETWTSLAAGWAGGSLSPPGGEPIPPPQHLTAKAVRAATLIALAGVGAKERAPALESFVEACLRFADGGDARVGWRPGAGVGDR